MNCRDLSHFLDEYLAGDLPATVASEFEMHISRCGNCDTYLLQYRETISLGRAAAGEIGEAPEELIQAIIASLRAAK
jgi:anti-sigma factor RsiW